MQRLRSHDLPFHMFVYLLSHVYRDVYRDGFVDYCHNRLVGMNGSGQRRRDPPTDTEAYVCNVCVGLFVTKGCGSWTLRLNETTSVG